ncbi:hypothetical protein ACJ41O_006459 [Fusarium nematophilum]
MASNNRRPLFFLNPDSTRRPLDDRQLTAEARAHVSRQSRAKSTATKPKNFKFVSYTPETTRRRHRSGGSTHPDDDYGEDHHLSVITGAGHGVTDPINSRRMSPCPPKPAGWDPFKSFNMSSMGSEEQMMLHYAFTATWPQFGEFDSGRRQFAQSWLWRTLESPAAFYSGLMGSSTHYTISCPTASIRDRILMMGLKWKIQAISAVRSVIEEHQSGSPISNSDLLAIFVLAIHGSMDLSEQPEPHPLSPLATYRHMHVYGRMKPGKAHVNAIYYLVEEKGGISKIDQHAFGFVLPM